ncbi:hypothetical protein CKO36_00420 [Rhabdochromatium marinum]|nr:IS5 family transposase [Rhabdochromatium marinum]MBK1647103.1 hypothetical protein [Rhabdochromatium marinum]
MNRQGYPSDVTDAQWAIIAPLLPNPNKVPGGPGRPPADLRLIVNGIFYQAKAGCQWRLLPHEFGPWQTVYDYFNRWSRDGVWAEVMEALHRLERERQGRAPEPMTGSIDSQSVKSATQGNAVGFDGGKQTKGRKRHLLVDTLGLMLTVVVMAANVGDRAGLKQLLRGYFDGATRWLRKIWVDGGYDGVPLKAWLARVISPSIDLDVVQRPSSGFHLVKRRWVVERTFSWLFNDRRHSKDYEVLTRNSEAMIQAAMIHLLARRLA